MPNRAREAAAIWRPVCVRTGCADAPLPQAAGAFSRFAYSVCFVHRETRRGLQTLDRRRLLLGIAALGVAPMPVRGASRYRIGMLAARTPATGEPFEKTFVDALREHGWLDGSTV